MADVIHKVRGPDGKIHRIKGPADASPQEIAAFAESQFGKQREWSDVPGEALQNLPGSAYRFGESMVYPFLNPIATLNAFKQLGIGLGSKAAGMFVDQDPATKEENEAAVNAVGQFIKDRYGSVEAFKETLATDPVGAAADISMLITGGGSAVARAPGAVGKAGQIVQTAGRAIDPITGVAKAVKGAGSAVGSVGSNVLGITTGSGGQSFKQAYRAGKQGGQQARAFTEAMRGKRDIGEVVDVAKAGVNDLIQRKNAEYVANTATLRSSKKPMNLSPVDQKIQSLSGSLNYKGFVKDTGAAKVLDDIKTIYGEFKDRFQGQPITAEALDALKRRLREVRQSTEPGTGARRVADQMYRSVRDEIKTQVPKYGKAMSAYEAQMKKLERLNKELSLGEKASPDTSLRKILATTRDNAATNWGMRSGLIDDLAKTQPELPNLIAGHALSSKTPRGLAQYVVGAGAVGLNPSTILAAPITSPRLMGEVSYGFGKMSGAAGAPARAAASYGVPVGQAASGARAVGEYIQPATSLEDQRPSEEELAILARILGR